MKYKAKSEKDIEREVPKYKKKSNSSNSKSFNKSEHKHMYKRCLFKEEKLGVIYEGSYCVECGKILNFVRPTEIRDGKTYYLSSEEILSNKKYKKLEMFDVESVMVKYVTLNK